LRTTQRTQGARALAPCVVAALVLAMALTATGCAGSVSKQSTPAALKLQREDLASVARTLTRVQPAVARETALAKAAWPTVVKGLTSAFVVAPKLRLGEAALTKLQIPAMFGELQARSLTSPAAGIAGLFRYSTLLITRGWTMAFASAEQISRGSPAAVRFARENIGLYVESIYDGQFGLAQIGKKLLAAYEKLGGPEAFRATLTQTQVNELARSYSEASLRLYPHPPVRVGS
jgi:hypothetical protein